MPKARTTISINGPIYSLAMERMRALDLDSFSEYIEWLLKVDIREQPRLIIAKEENPGYRSQRILRPGMHIEPDQPKPPKGKKGSRCKNPPLQAPPDI